jgi:DNA-binding response OmpR family regulator
VKVLLIDDEPIITKLISAVMKEDGWEIETAHSLAEAKAKAGPFDVIVADVRLPNGDGRHLKELHPETPFIVISGFPGERADLVKPFSPEELKRKVLDAAKQNIPRAP